MNPLFALSSVLSVAAFLSMGIYFIGEKDRMLVGLRQKNQLGRCYSVANFGVRLVDGIEAILYGNWSKY